MLDVKHYFLFIVLIIVSCNQVSRTPFDLNEFPKDWVSLTETDSGLIIYNTCDMGNTLLRIENNGNSFNLLIHGGQEDFRSEIIESFTDDSQNIFLKTNRYDETIESYKFSLVDSTDLIMNATYYSIYDTTNFIFTQLKNESSFLTVNQPCIECWEQEECDYLDSLISIKE